MVRAVVVILAQMFAVQALAQGDFAPPPPKDDPLQVQTLKPLPAGVILLPGAVPSASDAKTPLPESGNIHKNVYENAYFGMRYEFPQPWREEFSGPPPSDTGAYVLANLTGGRASILVTAQDKFFALTESSPNLPTYYKLEREPLEIKIGDALFSHYSYSAPAAGLHWYVFSTEIRCHDVQFVMTSQDTRLLDDLVENLKQITLTRRADTPRCMANYARAENIVYKVDPVLNDQKFNVVPVRIIIGRNGRVKHVHVLSAFAQQSQLVTDALLQWRFKPAETDIETGIVFGSTKTRKRDPGTQTFASE